MPGDMGPALCPTCRQIEVAAKEAQKIADRMSSSSVAQQNYSHNTSGSGQWTEADSFISKVIIGIASAVGTAFLLNHFTQSINNDWIVWGKGGIVVICGIIGYIFGMFVWRTIKYILIIAVISGALAVGFFFVRSLVSKTPQISSPLEKVPVLP